MPLNSDIESRYIIHLSVEVREAEKHIRDGEPRRAIHHLLKAYMPGLAFAVYKLAGGKAESIQNMLLESREIVKESDGIDWITLMYGKDYNL